MNDIALPHDNVAEQAVIGSILLRGECITEVYKILRPDDFYSNLNRDVYRAMTAMYAAGKPIDSLTVLAEMAAARASVEQYFVQLLAVTPTWRNVKMYAEIVREKSRLRAVAEVAGEISARIADGESDSEKVLADAAGKIYALLSERSPNAVHISDAIAAMLLESEARKTAGVGVSTRLPGVDKLILGLNPAKNHRKHSVAAISTFR